MSLGSMILAVGHHLSTSTIEESCSTSDLELPQPKKQVVKRMCCDLLSGFSFS